MAVPLTMSALFCAVKNGFLSEIELDSLTQYGMPKIEGKITDYLVLQTALEKKQRKIAKLLIKIGCRVKAEATDRGMTPLALAFKNEWQDIALSIIKKKGTTTMCVESGSRSNVLHLVVQRRSLKMMKFLFNKCNIGVNHPDNDGKMALQRLLETYINPQFKSHIGEKNKIEMIKLLLLKGASVDFRSSNGNTALHYVVAMKEKDIIKSVLKKCNDVNLRNEQGKTALHILLSSNYETEHDVLVIFKLFMEKGAKCNIADSKGVTLLHIAATKKYCIIMQKLLDYQCDVSLTDCQGNTILHNILEYSAHLTDEESFLCSVERILSVAHLESVANSSGETPVHIAAGNTQYKILQKMLPNYANVNAQNQIGETILHILTRKFSYENYNYIRDLLSAGASLDLKNAKMQTPLEIALILGNETLLILLLPYCKDASHQSIFEYLLMKPMFSSIDKQMASIIVSKGTAAGVIYENFVKRQQQKHINSRSDKSTNYQIEVRMRINLLNIAQVALSKLLLFPFSPLFFAKIFKLLNNEDLINIIQAAQIRSLSKRKMDFLGMEECTPSKKVCCTYEK